MLRLYIPVVIVVLFILAARHYAKTQEPGYFAPIIPSPLKSLAIVGIVIIAGFGVFLGWRAYIGTLNSNLNGDDTPVKAGKLGSWPRFA